VAFSRIAEFPERRIGDMLSLALSCHDKYRCLSYAAGAHQNVMPVSEPVRFTSNGTPSGYGNVENKEQHEF